jgi:hypothetical protein
VVLADRREVRGVAVSRAATKVLRLGAQLTQIRLAREGDDVPLMLAVLVVCVAVVVGALVHGHR